MTHQLSLLTASQEAELDAHEGDRFRDLLAAVVENAGCKVVAGHTGQDLGTMCKGLRGQGGRHPHAETLPALVLRFDADRRIVRYLCALAGGDFVERDRRSPEQKLEALQRAIEAKLGTSSPVVADILIAAKLTREGA